MPKADVVLEGGGVKGIALAGAISVLMERGYEFNRVAGTSAGSIVGALVAAGMSRDELVSTVTSIDYHEFQDGPMWDGLAAGKIFELFAEHGIYRGDYLRTWLGEQLAAHGVHSFADLRYTDPERPPADPDRAYRLVVNVSDITAGCLRQLPWGYREHYQRDPADEPVADAVRCSMSIPFFYQPVVLDDGTGHKHWIVDGGMLSNFPIDLFDAPPGVEPRWPTFGIKLSSRPDAVQEAVANEVHGVASMSLALLNTMTGFYDRMHVDDPAVLARTIFVDTGHVKSTDFDLTDTQRDTLFENGRAAATAFLDGTDGQPGWDFEQYKHTHRAA
ncbi:MAG TPA: patatin-like phospholipase family protein [Actinomycetes bacterium]